jgi:hypothetical protein
MNEISSGETEKPEEILDPVHDCGRMLHLQDFGEIR